MDDGKLDKDLSVLLSDESLVVDDNDCEALPGNPYDVCEGPRDVLTVFEGWLKETDSPRAADLTEQMDLVVSAIAGKGTVPGLDDRLFEILKHHEWPGDRSDFDVVMTDGFKTIVYAPKDEDEEDEKKRRSIADRIIASCTDDYLYSDEDKECYADCQAGGHLETYRVRSTDYRELLASRHFDATGKAATQAAVDTALNTLNAKARFGIKGKRNKHEVHVRVGKHDGNIYLDLGTNDWRVVEITQSGWRIIPYASSPCKFVRSAQTRPLPMPVSGGSLDGLKELVRFQGDDDFVLVVGWLHGALSPDGPYPVLALSGSYGTSKTTTSRMLRRLVDNRVPLDTATPKTIDDLMVAAKHQRILAFDNISFINDDLSDALCRVSTGGGLTKRQHYTNAEEITLNATRPVILNGIGDMQRRSDLTNRMLPITLLPISDTERETIKDIEARFDRLAPEILGALLDGVVVGLETVDTIVVHKKPRMADFVVWAAACSAHAHNDPKVFLEAYDRRAADMLAVGLDNNSVADGIYRLFELDVLDSEKLVPRTKWEGTVSELRNVLKGAVGATDIPDNPGTMGRRIQDAIPILRHHGIEVVSDGKQHGKKRRRLTTITRIPTGEAPQGDLGEATPSVPASGGTPGSSAQAMLKANKAVNPADYAKKRD